MASTRSICPRCKKVCKSLAGLKVHIRAIHPVGSGFVGRDDILLRKTAKQLNPALKEEANASN